MAAPIMKTLRVSLVDLGLVPAGPGATVSGEVWAELTKQVRTTDGLVIVLAAPRKVLSATGVVDFSVPANNDAGIMADDRGFGVTVGWDLKCRGVDGSIVPVTNKGTTVLVTTASPAIVLFASLAEAVPTDPLSTYPTEAEVDAKIAAAQVAASPVFNVKTYGAVGNGVTDDRAAVVAAIAAVATAGRGVVYFPAGTYAVSSRIVVTASNITFRGDGLGVSVLKATGSALGVMDINGISNSLVEDLGFEHAGAALTPTTPVLLRVTVSGSTQNSVTVQRCRFLNGAGEALRATYAITNFVFDSNEIVGCWTGISMYAPTSGVTSGVKITNNRISGVSNMGIQVYGGTAYPAMNLHNIDICGNTLKGFVEDLTNAPNGPIPIEPTGVTNLKVLNNTIVGPSTRGISMGANFHAVIDGNIITDQSVYAFELSGHSTVVGGHWVISNNVMRNCASFGAQTANNNLSDILITGNSYTSSGKANGSGPRGTVAILSFSDVQNLRISDNTITDWQYCEPAVRIGIGALVAQDVVVEDNTFINTVTATPFSTISAETVKRCTIRNNHVYVKRDLVVGDNNRSCLVAVPNTASEDVTISGNDVVFTGTTSAAANTHGIGNGFVGSVSYPVGFRVQRNRVLNGQVGMRIMTNLATVEVTDNDTRSCALADYFEPNIILRRTKRRVTLSAAPTTGTWAVGDRAENSAPAVGSAKAWLCTVAGTPGTWVSEGNL